jgi:death on curing protein
MSATGPTDEPDWIVVQTIYQLHQDQIDRFGGHHGVLDANAVESALARPIHKWHDARADWAALAAAYLCGFAQKQAFIDGNKRTGLVAALTFLDRHGLTIDVPAEELYALTLLVARNEIAEPAVATWFRVRVS